MAILRLGSLGSLGLLIGALVFGSHPAAGQDHGAAPPLVITAFGDKPAPRYSTRRLSWGEPDLQGVWSSDDTAGIPLQRPEKYGNQRYLTEQEYADRAKQVARGVDQAEKAAVSSFRSDFARRAFAQTSIIVDPADGRMPAYTAEGTKRPMPRGTYGNGPLDSVNDFSLYERCITRGIAGSTLRVVYGNGQRIVQAPGVVALSYEMVHDTRLIYTDGRPHINQAIHQYLGDSRAHWEGDELVVETTNLTDRTAIGLNGNGNRHSTQMKLVERISRVDKDELRYEVRVDDPKTYTAPFTLSLPLTSPPGYELLPYECHEGNYMLPHSLSAEREEDAAIEADRQKGIVRKRKSIQQNLDAGAREIPGRANPNDEQ